MGAVTHHPIRLSGRSEVIVGVGVNIDVIMLCRWLMTFFGDRINVNFGPLVVTKDRPLLRAVFAVLCGSA